MGDLLDWLLNKENKKPCRFAGIVMLIIPLSFFLGGGFLQGIEGNGIPFSAGWFREIFVVLSVLMFGVGLILTITGFSKDK